MIPQATPDQQRDGWTIEFEFLKQIAQSVELCYGENVTLEEVESVLLAAGFGPAKHYEPGLGFVAMIFAVVGLLSLWRLWEFL